MSSFFRIVSIIAYLLIFLQGSMILLPFVLMLVVGMFSAEPFLRVLLIIGDAALITLLLLKLFKWRRWIAFIEVICFIGLLLPLIKIFFSFSFDWFNYFLFLFPTICFLVLFPISIFLGHRDIKREERIRTPKFDFSESSDQERVQQ